MENINAVITGVGGYVPDYILTNDEISKMVDTTDEWIMGRIGIKERRILKDQGLGTSYIARKAVKQLIKRTHTNPDDIDLVIVATTTPDYRLPSTASILCERLELKRAFAFDITTVCKDAALLKSGVSAELLKVQVLEDGVGDFVKCGDEIILGVESAQLLIR